MLLSGSGYMSLGLVNPHCIWYMSLGLVNPNCIWYVIRPCIPRFIWYLSVGLAFPGVSGVLSLVLGSLQCFWYITGDLVFSLVYLVYVIDLGIRP